MPAYRRGRAHGRIPKKAFRGDGSGRRLSHVRAELKLRGYECGYDDCARDGDAGLKSPRHVHCATNLTTDRPGGIGGEIC